MALTLNEIKRPKRRKNDQNTSVKKGKPLAPFQRDSETLNAKTFSDETTGFSEVGEEVLDHVLAAPGSPLSGAVSNPTSNTNNSNLTDSRASKSESKIIGAQLEHSDHSPFESPLLTTDNKSTIRAQLEHKGGQQEISIGAQLEHNSESSNDFSDNRNGDKSTIGAQIDDNTIDEKLQIRVQLEHKNNLNNDVAASNFPIKSTIRARDPLPVSVLQDGEENLLNDNPDEVFSDSLIGAQLEHSDLGSLSTPIEPNHAIKSSEYPPELGISVQIDNNKSTIGAHKEHIRSTSKHLEHKTSSIHDQLGNKKGTDKSTNPGKIGAHKEHNTMRSDFEILSGLELKLLQVVHESCVEQSGLVTSKFSNHFLAENLGIKPNTLKTVIKRVVDKGFMFRYAGKRGRGGWIQFTICEELYRRMLYSHSSNARIDVKSTNRVQIDDNKSTNWITEKSTEAPSSSNFLIKNKTITKDEIENFEIPELLIGVGFTQTHVTQILSDGFFDLDEISESMLNFAYDLERNIVRPRSTPIRYFMGIVRTRKSQYRSEKLLEEERLQINEYLKRVETVQQAHQDEQMRLLEEKFVKWKSGLSREQINEIAPPKGLIKEGSPIHDRVLKNKYIEMVGTEHLDESNE